jgi:hypothetical protein
MVMSFPANYLGTAFIVEFIIGFGSAKNMEKNARQVDISSLILKIELKFSEVPQEFTGASMAFNISPGQI